MGAVAKLLLASTNGAVAYRAGLRKKKIEVNGYWVHYYEGGHGDTLVLLHGLADDKSSFLRTAQGLTRDWHVILPDLTGHGENEFIPERDYTVRGHVADLHAFVEAMRLDRFHLGGNSMGGHVSLAYSIHHPERVRSLILVNAPGLVVEDEHVVYTGFGSRMESLEDLLCVLDRVYHKRPKLPGFLLRHLMTQTNNALEKINTMARVVREGPDYSLGDRISEVAAPTLILWGKHDPVVKMNVAEAYRERIRDAKLVVFEDAAHSPQLEIPKRIGTGIKEFLSNLRENARRDAGSPAAGKEDRL
ncbi:alpha/beta hydrolase [Pendulispora rubella]|uniref:Alpha/beta hydrolase n=1 Tax=Pendulispora rubella TaxID=2741070 RepID=A0ABZ2KW45_9BACT